MEISEPLRLSNIIVREAGAELVLSSIEGKAIHVLNPTAMELIKRFQGGHRSALSVNEFSNSPTRLFIELLGVSVPPQVLDAVKPDYLRRQLHEHYLPEEGEPSF